MEVEAVSHQYAGTDAQVLNEVSLTIQENEFFTLLGPSGCGKTTMLRILAGFEVPSRGRVTLDGQDILRIPPWRRPVNTVFQSYALFPHLTILRNVTFGLKMRGVAKADRHGAARRALDLVRLDGFADRMPSDLSGGQQQRVALARALACQPRLLLLDEPLSALDYKLRKEMQGELKRIQRETGTSFVFVTHDQEEALAMSDRIAVMRQGTLEQVGNPSDIYDRPSSDFVAEFIGDSNLLNAAPDSQGRLCLPGGRALGIRGDAPARVMIRPEALRIAPDGNLSGQVTDLVYSGAATRFLVALDGGEETVQIQQTSTEAAGISMGDKVCLAYDPQQLWVVAP
ncbi:ABC transporter ATP-binding protein [Rhodobacteraceae bacterium F11138]|nr:ABC transporter ATP-binding protein [Rhodobacteraceae bacterium F11138]